MKKTVFVLLLVVMLLSLTLTAAFAGCPSGEDPYPPGTARNNAHARDPLVVIPSQAADGRAGFIPVSTPTP